MKNLKFEIPGTLSRSGFPCRNPNLNSRSGVAAERRHCGVGTDGALPSRRYDWGDASGWTLTLLCFLLAALCLPVQAQYTPDLIARFDAGPEGWTVTGGTLTWLTNGGHTTGALLCTDTEGSTWVSFRSPPAWSGDWRAYRTLRFMVRAENANSWAHRADYPAKVEIFNRSGSNLLVTLPNPYHAWTPYTVKLTPETFGVSSNQFDAVMSDVAQMVINGDFNGAVGSPDGRLDNVLVLKASEIAPPSSPPEHASAFSSGPENWRYGTLYGADWWFAPPDPNFALWSATGGTPVNGGCLLQTVDLDGGWNYWYSPEAWAGDWRGLESVAFDFKIVQGTSVQLPAYMLSVCSPWTNLVHASVATPPVPGQWMHYEIALTPATFGVTQADFEKAMRDAVMLCIRSEWIIGAPESEAMDNFRLWAGVPSLTVTRSNSAVIVSWPGPAEGWVLEWTNALPSVAAPWPEIPPPYQTNGANLQFTKPAPTGDQFYRLHKP